MARSCEGFVRKSHVDWPVDRLRGFDSWVNEPPAHSELKTIRACIPRRRPMADLQWTTEAAEKLDLGWTFRPRGGASRNALHAG